MYISKNSAPRAVYEAKLTGSFNKSKISNLFGGSGSFVDVESNIFDCLIVDEAHRLNAKSGLFSNQGENQIKEIINASKFSIFFIDEDQKVTWKDIGEKGEIEKLASELGANVTKLSLDSQFRCNGSDGYLAWLDNVLGIHETANTQLDLNDYDFRIVSSPTELKNLIIQKNRINNKSRMVAGYCWDWKSKNNKEIYDIEIPEYDFQMKWNLSEDGGLWIQKPNSVNEIGCIHTCQGLELDYVGVIIGNDFVVREGKVITNPLARAKTDQSIKGFKKEFTIDAEKALKKADSIIKNTYRTLMTRGMKGCYVYFVDKETEEYFRQILG